MSGTVHETEHQVKVRAPAATAYRLIADVANWSWIFPTTVHAEKLAGNDRADRIGVWTTTDGTVNHWVGLRELDPVRLRVGYRQETARPPVAEMGGAWIFEPISAEECLVRLVHDYRAAEEDPGVLQWIADVLDRLSTAEIAAFQAGAELAAGQPDRLLSFADTVPIVGRVADVYEFLRDPRRWVGRVPDVVEAEISRDVAGVQTVATRVRTGKGTHASALIRVCLPPTAIAYRHFAVPPLASVHTGEWLLRQQGDTTLATSRHTVVFDEQGIAAVLGAEAGLAQAREFARRELAAGGIAVLEAAGRWIEQKA
ncbi:SRPBCC family protein [Micromonosporaceae bacterium B7E4]